MRSSTASMPSTTIHTTFSHLPVRSASQCCQRTRAAPGNRDHRPGYHCLGKAWVGVGFARPHLSDSSCGVRRLTTSSDATYLALVVNPIKVCAKYKPKLGQGNKGDGLTLSQFRSLYQADSFYSWFGLDNPLMYAAHKAAGGMTSVYRQIGIGCEKLFRTVLRDSLGLTDDDVKWSYEVQMPGGKFRSLHLDGRVPLDKIADQVKRERFQQWMLEAADGLGVDTKIAESLTGTVFEVRQGYKSKDSKRQNADIANAATAYTMAYLPCAAILSGRHPVALQSAEVGRGNRAGRLE